MGRFFLLLNVFFTITLFTLALRIFFAAPEEHPMEETEKRKMQVTYVFAGDVMVHDSQIEAAYNPKEKSYCFHSCFEQVAPILQDMDVAVVNLETTLSGADQNYSGYPAFNTPESLASALKTAGFHLVSTANNHALDRGEYGVIQTLEHLEEAGLKPFGTHRSWEERETSLIVEAGGIRAAFLAYTYSTNGIPIPENKEYLVNLFEVKRIIQDMHRIRSKVDLIILSVHWGQEYQRTPTESQREIARHLLEEGASIIIGNHPHVVQPLDRIEYSDGGEKRNGLVAYSLGNFIGDQILPYTDTGIMVFVTVEKEDGGEIDIIDVSYVPTWIHDFYYKGERQFRILPILPEEEYFKELKADPVLNEEMIRKLKVIQKEMEQHIGDFPQGYPRRNNREHLEN